MKALADALKDGDLSAAQSAFASLQKSLPSGPPPDRTSSTSASSQGSNPLQTLATALQSGDLAGAQAAFAAMQQNHRAHHHRRSDSMTTQAAPADSMGAGDSAQLLGSTLDIKA
jgi:hypothetical protein